MRTTEKSSVKNKDNVRSTAACVTSDSYMGKCRAAPMDIITVTDSMYTVQYSPS